MELSTPQEKNIAEMKVKEEPREEMEERKLCKNCKHEVTASNFSLHEAHCVRFLAVCPKCDEPVALKDMKEHFAKAHKEVRCNLCHQLTQQYLLERHEAEECPERTVRCQFCELDLPDHKLQAHLDTCGSRTTSCWHCGKYVMYKALKEHKVICKAKAQGRSHDSSANLCQHCHRSFPDEKFLQHLNECFPLPRLLGDLTTHSPKRPGSPTSPQHPPAPTSTPEAVERGAHPKKKELASTGRPSLKPPRSRKLAFVSTLASAAPQALEDSLYDTLVTCSQCNILLPSPTLKKHEKKCHGQTSLQMLRRSPRQMDKGEETM